MSTFLESFYNFSISNSLEKLYLKMMQIFWLDHYFLCLQNFLQRDFFCKVLLDSFYLEIRQPNQHLYLYLFLCNINFYLSHFVRTQCGHKHITKSLRWTDKRLFSTVYGRLLRENLQPDFFFLVFLLKRKDSKFDDPDWAWVIACFQLENSKPLTIRRAFKNYVDHFLP